MKILPLPPIEMLEELLDYDAATGTLTWKKNRGKVKAGDVAGSINHAGYRLISMRIDGKVKNFFAHRIAWALYYGEDPYPYEIDHKHHNRDDNRISELQLATRKGNARNRRNRNKYGVPGVIRHAGGWRVYCYRRYVGWTKDFEEARAMREQAEAEMLQNATTP